MDFHRVELEKAFVDGSLVIVCWEPDCLKHRLTHWGEETWVEHERIDDCKHYSHGICTEHARLLEEEIDEFFEQEAA